MGCGRIHITLVSGNEVELDGKVGKINENEPKMIGFKVAIRIACSPSHLPKTSGGQMVWRAGDYP